MTNGQQGQSTLQNVYSYSFTANNLFQVSLVRDNDPNRPTYKRQFFCFLTLAPGEKGQQGGRTYNFSNKINMKQDVHNVIALAHAFRAVARGQKQAIGNFSLFTDSSKSGYGQGGGVKQVFVNEYIKQNQQQTNQNMVAQERFVSLGFRFGNNKPIGLMFSVPDALACADILEYIGMMGLKLDASGASPSFVAKPPAQNQQPQQGGYSGQPMGQANQQPMGQANQPPNTGGSTQNPNSPDNIADNFEQGLQNASTGPPTGGSGPASPPPMGGGMDDDIPF
jgi:hypothetical protein